MIEEKTNIDRLRGIALDQYGYVTASQALDAGVSRAALSMLKKRGRVELVAHGVYRVPQVPPTELDRFMLAVLWTGTEEAALGYETALDAYGVCDVNPAMIHVTVGKGRRIARRGGEGYVLHREDVAEGDLTWWKGMPIATLRKAIEQCIDSGTSSHLLAQAIENGSARGVVLEHEAAALRERLEARDGVSCSPDVHSR